jgi:nucleoside-diphosphate-sugar epimerase
MLDENTPLAATDPYGQSKVQAERLFCGWADRHGIQWTILRLPLVWGEDPPGNLGAMITAMRAGRYFGVGSGKARKSIVWGMDVGRILLRAAREGGVYHLTDGHHPMFCEIERAVAARLGLRPPRRLPYPVAWGAAMAGTLAGALLRRPVPLDVRRFRKMTLPLTFDDHRARLRLGWSPCPVVEMIKVPHAPTRSTKSYKGS